MRTEKEIRSEIEKYELLITQAEQAFKERKLHRHSFFTRLDSYNYKLNVLKWMVGDRDATE